MDLTRSLLPAALGLLLLLDPQDRAQGLIVAAAFALASANLLLSTAPAAWGLPGSRSRAADVLRIANLLLIAWIGFFAPVPEIAWALLFVLALDSLVRRFLYYGAAIGLAAVVVILWGIYVPSHPLYNTYEKLWVMILIGLIGAHRLIVTVQAVRRRRDLISGQELYAKEAQQLERLVAVTEDVLQNRDVTMSLHSIARAVRDVFGFKYVSIVTADDTSGELKRSVMLGFPEDTQRAHLNEPVDFKNVLLTLSDEFETMQNCYFVPAEASQADASSTIYVGDLPRDAPRKQADAWHERDVLLLVLSDDEDNMVGYMSVDGPVDGKIPDNHTLRSMQIFVNLVGLALAITSSRAAQIERNRVLEEAGRLQKEFLSMVSHEVRSPLAAIRGAANLLRTRSSDLTQERRQDLLDTLGSATMHLNRIFEDLLLISQMDAGQLRLRIADVSPRAIVEDTIRQVLVEHPGRAISLIAPPNVPDVHADEGRAAQVVMNLLTNAAKYSEEGSIITVRVEPEPENVRVSISNAGPGIAPEDRGKLFTRFGSLSNTATSTGLGLYICKQLIDTMGGSIDCESIPGEHTTFWFTLPRGQREPSPLPAPVESRV